MKLNDTYFYCYSCGAHGDVVDFTAKLFGIQLWEAARKLLADFGIPMDMTPTLRQYPLTKAQSFQERERLCSSVLSRYHQHLLHQENLFCPKAPGQPWDDRFCAALREKDMVQYQLDVLLLGTHAEREQLIRELIESGSMETMRDHVNQYEQEQTND